MASTTRRIPLWIIDTVTGILIIGLIGILFYVHIPNWVHHCSNEIK